MKRFIETVLALCLAIVLGTVAVAEDKAKKADPDKKGAKKPEPFAAIFSFPKQIKATEDQLEKLGAIKKEYTPQLAEFQKKIDVIMTPERKKAAAEARKKAMDEGKKGKEVAQAGNEALKLSDEEKAQLKEINQARAKVVKEITEKKLALLTAEQKEQIKPKPKEKKTDK